MAWVSPQSDKQESRNASHQMSSQGGRAHARLVIALGKPRTVLECRRATAMNRRLGQDRLVAGDMDVFGAVALLRFSLPAAILSSR